MPSENMAITMTLWIGNGEVLKSSRVPRGSVVKCLTRNPGVLG